MSKRTCGSETIGTQRRAPVVLPPTQLGHIAGKAEVHGHEVDLAESVNVEAAEDGKPAVLKHILADSEQLLLEIRQRERLSAHMLALLSEGLEVAQGGGDFLFVLGRQVVDKDGFVWEVGAGPDQRAVESFGPAARDGGGKTSFRTPASQTGRSARSVGAMPRASRSRPQSRRPSRRRIRDPRRRRG